METTMPETYNPNLLVTYKRIEDGEASYQTDKVVQLEWTLEEARSETRRKNALQSKIDEITGYLDEDGWYNPNTELSDVLRELCRILDHNPTKTIEFSGTITFSGNIDVPLDESEDFDLFYHLQDNLTLDAYDGNIEINSYEVENVDQ